MSFLDETDKLNVHEIPMGFVVDDNGNALSFKDSTGYLRVYTYDDKGRLTSTRTETEYVSKFAHLDSEDEKVSTVFWRNSLGMTTLYQNKKE